MRSGSQPSQTDPVVRCAECRRKLLEWALRKLGCPHEAEDLCQPVLVECMTGVHGFRGQAAFETWLFAIQRRALASYLRDRAHHTEAAASAFEKDVAHDRAAGGLAAEDRLAVRSALERLAPRHRQLLEWKYVHGYSHDEIAAMLGIEEASARQAISRARRAFVEAYGREAAVKDG